MSDLIWLLQRKKRIKDKRGADPFHLSAGLLVIILVVLFLYCYFPNTLNPVSKQHATKYLHINSDSKPLYLFVCRDIMTHSEAYPYQQKPHLWQETP